MTMKDSKKLLTALFKDHESAEQAYAVALDLGYKTADITVLMADETREKYFPNKAESDQTALGSKAVEGMGVGSAVGGTLGALAAAIFAVGTSLVIPGLGLVVAGPLAAGLAGAGAGSAAGGLIGALMGAGIPSERATLYDAALKEGGIVIAVSPKTEEEASALTRKWESLQGENIFLAA